MQPVEIGFYAVIALGIAFCGWVEMMYLRGRAKGAATGTAMAGLRAYSARPYVQGEIVLEPVKPGIGAREWTNEETVIIGNLIVFSVVSVFAFFKW